MFRVTEYIGDYPIEKQLFWGETLRSKKAACEVAKMVFGIWLLDADDEDDDYCDYYVLVETVDESGIGEPVWGLSSVKFALSGAELTEFLAQFE